MANHKIQVRVYRKSSISEVRKTIKTPVKLILIIHYPRGQIHIYLLVRDSELQGLSTGITSANRLLVPSGVASYQPHVTMVDIVDRYAQVYIAKYHYITSNHVY